MPTSAHWGVSNSPKISVKSVQSAWADVGIGPYNAFKNRVGIFELFLVSRERSKKTEAVFLVALKGVPGKIKISPGSFSFGEAKENAVLHPQMFKRVFALDKSIVNNKKTPSPQ